LVREPSKVIPKLAAFTGIDLGSVGADAAAPDSDWTPDGSKADGQPFYSELYGKAISPEHIGRHVDVLSKDEIAAVERACAPLFNFYKVDNSVFFAKPVQGAADEIPSDKVEIFEIAS
jgi:hypothetical protein